MLGANTRYLVTHLSARWLGAAFPWGTLFVNLAGCLAIGAIATLVTGRLVDRPEIARQFLVIGFLGSLTTFSSFAWETSSLLRDGEWVRAVANVAVSVLGGLAGVRLGILLSPHLSGLL